MVKGAELALRMEIDENHVQLGRYRAHHPHPITEGIADSVFDESGVPLMQRFRGSLQGS